MGGDIDEESHLNVARHVKIYNIDKYFIKYFEYGPQRDLPVNPHEFNFSNKLLERSPISGDFITKYRECTKEAFEIYLRFLNNKNDLLYRRILSL